VNAAREGMDDAKRTGRPTASSCFTDGALAKEDGRRGEGKYTQATATFDTVRSSTSGAAVQSGGGKEMVNTAAAQVRGGDGPVRRRAGDRELRGDPQPDNRRRHRPAAVSGRKDGGGRHGRLLTVMEMSKVVGALNMAQDQAKEREGRQTTGDDHGPRRAESSSQQVTIVSQGVGLPTAQRCRCRLKADNPDERFARGPGGSTSDRASDGSKGATLIPALAGPPQWKAKRFVLIVDGQECRAREEGCVQIGVARRDGARDRRRWSGWRFRVVQPRRTRPEDKTKVGS